MGSASSIHSDKQVVIVGAGYGGTTLALAMKKVGINYTLISPGDCFQQNIGAVRAVVMPGFSEKICIPLKDTFGHHFKQGIVGGIKPAEKKVTLESGEELAYDILVIATGTKLKLPMKAGGYNRDQAIEMYNKEVEKIKAAKRVVIVGGGATGVETAAEVAVYYPDKEVTIIHSSDALVSPAFIDRSQERLRYILEEEYKIKLILGERITNLADIPEEGSFTLTTDQGTSIEADYILNAIGLKIESSAYENGLSDAMEENGALKVNEYLQVEGYDDIFAVGDCTNVKEAKLAKHAGDQAIVLAKTIKSLLTGGKLFPYKKDGTPVVAALSLGPNKGFGQTKGGTNVPSFLITKLKSKDLLTGRYWKDFGQHCPK